jgi:tRNA U34 2-thiouridine synthase MnmA/TrmU
MTRALGLISGGLDSLLAARLLQEQGIEVAGISFESPFFSSEKAKKGCEYLGIRLIVADITEELLDILKSPKHGFGKNMNPCIDCHALMIKKAGKVMEDEGFDFIFTGEVLGERPMSQNRESLQTVGRESGYGEFLLRPLSAKKLRATKPELDAKVDRERLLDISGRSRKRQISMAKDYGIKEYPSPAGGCRLTDPGLARRLKDLFDNEDNVAALDARLLGVGRHIRIRKNLKFIVGRNEKDNDIIEQLREESDPMVIIRGYPGPNLIARKNPTNEEITGAAGICAYYSDAPLEEMAEAEISSGGKKLYVRVMPAKIEKFGGNLIK